MIRRTDPMIITKEYGDVTLGQGDITLQGKFVEIKNSTTVPLGTTLIIGN
jgi:hypothetical protein